MKSNKSRLLLGLALVLIIGVTVMFSFQGGDDNIARELDEEPTISVYVNETGEIRKMKLEEYLAGVVAGEMFPDWPINAYAAQAIFARSFTFALMAEGGLHDKYGTDVSTNIEEAQAYNPNEITDDIRKAVEMTRGQVLTHNNRFVKGWFHAYSGGAVTTAKEGLDYQDKEPPFTKVVNLPANKYAPEDVTNWTAQYSQQELRNRLGQAGVNVGAISNIEITKRGPTERITVITVTGDQGTKTISGPAFRLAMDSTRMRSTLVKDFNFSDGQLTMTGTGYGHGVGLSQWDAFMMAKEGRSPTEIAKAFFDKVQIKKLYD